MSLNPLRASLFRPTTSMPISRIPQSISRISNRSIHYTFPRSTSNTTTSSTTHHAHVNQHAHQHASQAPRNGKKPSPHMVWYRDIVPAMIPIFLISTTLFLSLSLIRTHLSHSKSLSESNSKIQELESQLSQLRLEQKRQRVREKRERERILPLVVERVLQRVGVVGGEEDEEVEEVKELPRLL
ncbi:hypothetical protein I203_108545 [Kwoniella mangroviensis CBS 8507]|uniref:hypothetical protein n=1 Tax=Kwoniella mangroviensis CBS 8507 TaxID=1296122 RepID=UPI00080D47B3|nr:uncharacterized protein I203_05440 [Kwoniella mangroviensis CBS 8507]OCF65759.1 hypothetical protein I203_05440 [Kwoniella mangroviensis CBS 8507]